MALWDVAGKIWISLSTNCWRPVRDGVMLTALAMRLRTCRAPALREWAQMIREQPEGFTTYKIEPTQASIP